MILGFLIVKSGCLMSSCTSTLGSLHRLIKGAAEHVPTSCWIKLGLGRLQVRVKIGGVSRHLWELVPSATGLTAVYWVAYQTQPYLIFVSLDVDRRSETRRRLIPSLTFFPDPGLIESADVI